VIFSFPNPMNEKAAQVEETDGHPHARESPSI